MPRAYSKIHFLTTLTVKVFSFYVVFSAPLLWFYFLLWQWATPSFLHMQSSPFLYVFIAALWWASSWPVMIFLQTVWPSLMLIFFNTERERSPKKIIAIGERFRQFKMLTPQVFILSNPRRFWKNKVWGFSYLPTPLGSLLLIDKKLIESLTQQEFDIWICNKAAESTFNSFSSSHFLFFTIVPTFTCIGVFIGSALGKSDLTWLSASAMLSFLVALLMYRQLLIQRQRAIDRLTVNQANMNEKEYFNTLKSIDEIHPPSFFSKWFLQALARDREIHFHRWLWYQGWLPSALTPIFITISILFCLLMNHGYLYFPNSTPPVEQSNLKANDLNRLSTAVVNGNLRDVIQLISQGMPVGQKDPAAAGATPLLLALKNDDLEMAYLLLKMGANIRNESDDLGQNALFYALQSPHQLRTLNYALKCDVDTQHTNLQGLTAYDWALKSNWNDAAVVLDYQRLSKSNTDSRLPAHERGSYGR